MRIESAAAGFEISIIVLICNFMLELVNITSSSPDRYQ